MALGTAAVAVAMVAVVATPAVAATVRRRCRDSRDAPRPRHTRSGGAGARMITPAVVAAVAATVVTSVAVAIDAAVATTVPAVTAVTTPTLHCALLRDGCCERPGPAPPRRPTRRGGTGAPGGSGEEPQRRSPLLVRPV